MESFETRIRRERLLFDGSMGTLLGMMGYANACPELINADCPDVIRGIHERYIAAGADVIITNSLGATERTLMHKGFGDRAAELTRLAVENARRAAGDKAYVALDIGPTGEFLSPIGALMPIDASDTFYHCARVGRDAGADFALLETQTDIAECRLACLAARRAGLSAAASFTFDAGGHTLTGGAPECCALTLGAAGAMAIGVNCSAGPEEMPAIVKRMRAVSNLPVLVQPNAGLPISDGAGKMRYPYSPEDMLPAMRAILDSGASAIGGCCGTTPEHIALLRTIASGAAPAPIAPDIRYVCSARRYCPLDEAVNAMFEVDDAEELFDLDDSIKLALLDLSGMRPQAAMDTVLNAMSYSPVPLAFHAADKDTLTAALSVYAGVAAVRAPEALQNILDAYGAVRM